MCRFESQTWLMSRSLDSSIIIVTNLQAELSEVRTPPKGGRDLYFLQHFGPVLGFTPPPIPWVQNALCGGNATGA